jgi:hypothetical protein
VWLVPPATPFDYAIIESTERILARQPEVVKQPPSTPPGDKLKNSYWLFDTRLAE